MDKLTSYLPPSVTMQIQGGAKTMALTMIVG